MSKQKESSANSTPSVRRGTLASLRADVCAGCSKMAQCRTWRQFKECRGIVTMMSRQSKFNFYGIPEAIRKYSGRLPKIQSKVYAMLVKGKCSVGDISAALHIADPRGHIRDLRAKGIDIADEWVKSEEGVLHKRYWITKEEI